jgi:hypothetical protein
MGEGQVTVALVPGLKGAVVGWLEGGKAWARYASAAGVNGPAVALGASAGHPRLPRWIVEDTPLQKTHVVAAWTEKQGDVSQVRVAELGTRRGGVSRLPASGFDSILSWVNLHVPALRLIAIF